MNNLNSYIFKPIKIFNEVFNKYHNVIYEVPF